MEDVTESKKPEKPKRISLRARTPLRSNPSTVGFSATETSGGASTSGGTDNSLKVSQIMAAGGVTATPSTTGTLPKIRTEATEKSPSQAPPQDETPSTEQPASDHVPHVPAGQRDAAAAALHALSSTSVTFAHPNETKQDTQPIPQQSNASQQSAAGQKTSPFVHPVTNGWIPDIESIWPLLVIPFVTGIFISSFRWQHLLVFAVWIMGYFTLFSLDVWLRSGRRERFWKPVRTYTIITTVLCVVLLTLLPSLLEWSIAFLILTAIGLRGPAKKQRQTLQTRSATIFTSCMMLVVAYDVGTYFNRSSQSLPWLHHVITQQNSANNTWVPYGITIDHYTWAAIMALSFFAFFWSNMFFVSSLIRSSVDKRRRSFIVSVVIHTVFCAAIWALAAFSIVPITHAVIWLIPFARAIILPVYMERKLAARQGAGSPDAPTSTPLATKASDPLPAHQDAEEESESSASLEQPTTQIPALATSTASTASTESGASSTPAASPSDTPQVHNRPASGGLDNSDPDTSPVPATATLDSATSYLFDSSKESKTISTALVISESVFSIIFAISMFL